ncbi:MAG: 23S rRNA (pseudouridine1915-N3)-methyltransferase [Oceanicoccus sp.]|jgi:23S rRNA (pseudouridine1915-N3)-methyltransferase
MKIQILQFSATKDKHLNSLELEFEKRLRPYFNLETITLTASKADERAKVQLEERDKILAKLDPRAHIIALDERGKLLTSPELAKHLLKQRDFGPGKVQLLIGGSHGLHPDVLEAAHFKLSLSKMTFTHEMVRVFLKEQLYRAAMILARKPYHK